MKLGNKSITNKLLNVRQSNILARSQGKVHCHTAKLELNQRVTIDWVESEGYN
jgi:hypothetical protein